MTENPYQPPSIPEEAEPAVRPDYLDAAAKATTATRSRPWAVVLICGFYCISGLFTVRLVFHFVGQARLSEGGMHPFEWAYAGFEFGLPIVLMLVGVTGLWLGRRWGLLALGFQIATVIGGVLQAFVWILLAQWNPNLGSIPLSNVIAMLVKGTLQSAAFFYLMSPPVLAYCGVALRHRWVYFALLLASGAAWLWTQQFLLNRVLGPMLFEF